MATAGYPVVCLLGPTAAGKTAAALALADALPVDLISVDSAQVYRGMDIGSAKLEPELLARYPHALIDIREPHAGYSVAEFCADATAAIQGAHRAGRIPILVGGTMMYVQALMRGLAALPGADEQVRAELEQQAARSGWQALHARLAEVDPVSAARIEPGDAQRIQRALEVFYSTGEPLSERLQSGMDNALQSDTPWCFLVLALTPLERHILHARIQHRVQVMLGDGLIDEVEQLRGHPQLNVDCSSMRSVGYRQVWSMLDGELSTHKLADEIVIATRQLAKRQLTWLRQMPGVIWVNGVSASDSKGVSMTFGYDFMINRIDIFASNSPLTTV